ncbi:hypothetical protein [Nocardiopsis metallicus]|uniref:Uncharacterized protein n=1 Tax=Nocardiopsis metallicus TaxID=179819 RepID=A0A840VXB1_9ACTN|nr:hypothetical protein [Nocardiopsis metallicus]MBB5489070.1 hypothetical protein [Nocardiopsis metallicus]
MSTPNERSELEFEDQLRQILKAEAGEVKPSGEGLNLIRERTERQRGSAWFGLPWLRPASAVAAAVLIVASVIMSSPQVRDQVLEIVPAGADREGTPPEAQQDGGDSVAAPEPTTDSATGTSKPEETPGQEPEDEAGPDGGSSSAEDESLESTASCPPGEDGATATNGTRDEDKKNDDRDNRGSDHPDCDPADEPADKPTDEPGSGSGGGNGDDPEDDESGNGSGDGSGSGGGNGGGSGSNGDEESGTSQN